LRSWPRCCNHIKTIYQIHFFSKEVGNTWRQRSPMKPCNPYLLKEESCCWP
jgi:hypothetical protein